MAINPGTSADGRMSANADLNVNAGLTATWSRARKSELLESTITWNSPSGRIQYLLPLNTSQSHVQMADWILAWTRKMRPYRGVRSNLGWRTIHDRYARCSRGQAEWAPRGWARYGFGCLGMQESKNPKY